LEEVMKVFLDDIRNPQGDGWTICRTGEEAIKFLDTGKVKFISFDHDLGEFVMTGHEVAKYILDAVAHRKIPMPAYAAHSANPVGRANIIAVMEHADRIWKKIQDGSWDI
jgi:CheY-like chemotaxis protein